LNARRSQRLFDPLFTTERMREIFSDHGRVQSMLDFEAALARAEAQAGNPAIPLVKALTALVAANDPDAGRFVHWGATSQDAMDTGLVLQLRSALSAIARALAARRGGSDVAADH